MDEHKTVTSLTETHAGCGGRFDQDPESGVVSCQRCRTPRYACTVNSVAIPDDIDPRYEAFMADRP